MPQISVNDLKNGITLELDNGLFQVVEFQHVKPGKGGAFVRSKIRNVRTGGMRRRRTRTAIAFVAGAGVGGAAGGASGAYSQTLQNRMLDKQAQTLVASAEETGIDLAALKEAQTHCQHLGVLGSYPRSKRIL